MRPTDTDLRIVELLPGGEHITSRPIRFVAALDDRDAITVQARDLRASVDMVPVLSVAIATASALTGVPVAILGGVATEEAEDRRRHWPTAETPRTRATRSAGRTAQPGVSHQSGITATDILGVIADMAARITRSLEHASASANIVGGHYYRDDYALGRGEGYRTALREATAALSGLLSAAEIDHEGSSDE